MHTGNNAETGFRRETRSRGRAVASFLAAAIVLTAGAQALALDAYRDRRGLFGGISVGAGAGSAEDGGSSGEASAKGSLDNDSHIGYNLRARLGGGVNQSLTLDGEFGLHLESYDELGIDVTTTLITMQLGANLFIVDGLYVRGMGGVASITTEFDGSVRNLRDEETGLTVGGGAGYEFFANGDLAVGVGFDYQRALFSDVPDFTTINFGVTATWY